MAATRCPSCGARPARRAATCPACGAAVATPGSPVDAVGSTHLRVEAVGDPLAADQGTAVEFGGGPRRWAVGVAVLAALAVLLAAGALLSPGTGDTATSTTATATSTSTTAPAPPSTAVRTTTTQPPPPAVVLPAPATGRLLLTTEGRTLAVDLASGATGWLDGGPFDVGPFDVGPGLTVVQLGDALVGNVKGALQAVPLDGTPARPFRADEGFRVWGEPGNVGVAWVEVDRFDSTAVQPVSARGDNLDTAVEVPQGTRVLAFVDGRFTLDTGDRLYRWDPVSGAVDALTGPGAIGVVVVADGPWAVARRCDDRLRCTRSLVDLRTGTAEPLAGPLAEPTPVWSSAVSRDGRFVADVVAGEGGGLPNVLRLLDRTTGVARQVRTPTLLSGDGVVGMDLLQGLAFSADSRVLFFVARTRLFAWVLTEPDPVAVVLGERSVEGVTVVPVT